MNDDVAEVNRSDPPMLPGSFLHEKERGYETSHHCQSCHLFNTVWVGLGVVCGGLVAVVRW